MNHKRPRDSSFDPATSALVQRAASEDGERFADLYQRVAPAIYAWASLRVGSGLKSVLDPEDVVQEVWCRALDRFETYDAQRASFRTWIFAIANNVLLESFRRIRRPSGLAGASAVLTVSEIPDEATSVSQRVARDESLRALIAHVTELEPDDRELLIYHGLEGLRHEDVAQLLSISADAAAKRWQRLLTRLRGLGFPDELLATQ